MKRWNLAFLSASAFLLLSLLVFVSASPNNILEELGEAAADFDEVLDVPRVHDTFEHSHEAAKQHNLTEKLRFERGQQTQRERFRLYTLLEKDRLMMEEATIKKEKQQEEQEQQQARRGLLETSTRFINAGKLEATFNDINTNNPYVGRYVVRNYANSAQESSYSSSFSSSFTSQTRSPRNNFVYSGPNSRSGGLPDIPPASEFRSVESAPLIPNSPLRQLR